MTTFGERLRSMRREAGLSQHDLAGDTLSPSYVSLLEADKRQPSAEVIRHLADRLGCTPAQLDAGGTAEQARIAAALTLEYARIAVANGAAADAVERLTAALAQEGVDRTTADELTLLLATALELTDDVVGAVALLQPLFERSLERRTHLTVSVVGQSLTARYLQTGDLNTSVEVGERALHATEAAGLAGTDDHLRLAATVIWAHVERGDLLEAATLAARYAEVAQQHGNRAGQAMVHWNAALVAEADGRLDEALALARRASAYLSEAGTSRHLVRLRTQLAWYLVRADPAAAGHAATLLDDVRADLADLCGPADTALWDCHRGYVHLLLGQAADAEQLARRALLALTGQELSERALALLILGDAVAAQDRAEEAVGHWRGVVEVLAGRPGGRQKAATLREAAERLLDAGQADGVAALRQALDAAGIRLARASTSSRAEPAVR